MNDSPPNLNAHLVPYARGAIGAVIGGVLGYLIFMWIARQGLYAMMLPGALLGFGCAAASRLSSNGLGIACAVAALGLGIFSEWKFAPFVADDSFGFFVSHLLELKPMTLIMIALGGVLAYWLGKGSDRPTQHQTPQQ